jgi:hypothetical protein
MERRRFGSTKREISAIGQGTWYIDEANLRYCYSRSAPGP